ncbi:murein transglycosylase A [Aerosakkonemataceae cyanobacterium BLCC-F154]|uniref:peptidoglycan lytic exotransglycosylase n=1 Tax=Floridaenema fluviatile BLCC-F154 TaxID=3153640 RepID=A0ABV4YJJ7_9CYAN
MKKTLTLISLNVGLLTIAYGLVLTFWQQSVKINPVTSEILIPELPDPQILLRDALPPAKSLPVLLPAIKNLPDYMGVDERIWGENQGGGDRIELLKAIDNSLRYLASSQAITDYQNYPISGITRDRVIRSLTRFRQLVRTSRNGAELWEAVQKEFVFYQSIGRDGLGNVLFTAYYEPLYDASRKPTAEYRYPIYRLPQNLKSWSRPHPTREELEGKDGLQGSKGKLKGLELFWLRDRLEAYLIHIQGSAKLRLTDGKITTVGYAGNTAYNYSSIGKALADDGKLPLENLTMPVILQYFHENPQELDNYLPRDRSFVFFQENYGRRATGSLSVPLTADRSIATDKSIMPPGALALIHAPFPYTDANQKLQFKTVSRYVLDQDMGGAIKGAGRVDYFVGTGKVAGERAGMTVSNGYLYYPLLKR